MWAGLCIKAKITRFWRWLSVSRPQSTAYLTRLYVQKPGAPKSYRLMWSVNHKNCPLKKTPPISYGPIVAFWCFLKYSCNLPIRNSPLFVYLFGQFIEITVLKLKQRTEQTYSRLYDANQDTVTFVVFAKGFSLKQLHLSVFYILVRGTAKKTILAVLAVGYGCL